MQLILAKAMFWAWFLKPYFAILFLFGGAYLMFIWLPFRKQ